MLGWVERCGRGGWSKEGRIFISIIDFELAAILFLDKGVYMSRKSARNFKETENDVFLLIVSGCQK